MTQQQMANQDKYIVESTHHNVTHTLTRSQKGATEDDTGRGTPISEVETGEQGGTPGKKAGKGYLGSDELAFTVASTQDQNIYCYENHANDSRIKPLEEGIAPTVSSRWGTGGNSQALVQQEIAMQVRRLTPLECERLQGFPPHWTRIPWRKKSAEDCPDGPRYKAIGNSMAVNVMQWIGLRIAMVEELDYDMGNENRASTVSPGNPE